ncbi:MAG: radical SAM protein [Planctomycetes bacterium]|nr:radical SAM protein [Planctomycetota bacterium]
MASKPRHLEPAVVLVADRTLAADYRCLFEGMFATMQTTRVPGVVMRRVLAPPVATDSLGRARTAPIGLRRIEASLADGGPLDGEQVACTTPEALPKLLGPWTKVVGVSSGDPLGWGMSNTTTAQFFKGELYSRRWTLEMLGRISRARRRYGFSVVFGGGGAWQWSREPGRLRDCGIDAVYEGYFESAGPGLFADLLAGRAAASHVAAGDAGAEGIRPIRGASLLGTVELSRGCGRGCRFCAMARLPMRHLPAGLIASDLQTNVSAGVTSAVIGSEDFLRYGSRTARVDFEAVRGLLAELRRVEGVQFIQPDHANVSSAAQLSVEQLSELRRLLARSRPSGYLWVNMGLESANGELVARVAPGKVAPFRPEDWQDVVRQAAEKMAAAGFFCVFSVILGLPGETPEDLVRTRRLVTDLAAGQALAFPIFYEPLPDEQAAGARRFTPRAMTAEHLDLFAACYEVNFRKVPRLYWDNQRAAGVSWFKRMITQALGRVEVVSWRRAMVRMGRTSGPRPAAAAARAGAN